MIDDPASRWTVRRLWPSAKSRVGRIGVWLSAAVCACLILRLLLGHGAGGGAFMGLGIFLLFVAAPFLLILLYRLLSRRLLWKVRNRLIVTYLLMGLAPLVMFATLTAIAGYILAGQYSINSALTALDEAQDQLKSETSGLASLLASPELKVGKAPVEFEQNSNPREAENSLAVLKNGTWQTLLLSTHRGVTPVSPFEGQPRPAWLNPSYHGVVAINGKLYLCYDQRTQNDTRSAEVLGALELNHATLNSMATSLGRMLVFSGFGHLHGNGIDGAEKEAQTAETEADRAQEAQEAQRDAQQQRQEAQRDVSEAQRSGQEEINDAKRDLEEAQREASRDRASGDDATELQQGLREAQDGLKKAQEQAQKGIQDAQRNVPPDVPPSPPVPPPPLASPAIPKRPFKLHVQPPSAAKPHAEITQSASPSAPPGNDTNGEFFTAVSGGVLPATTSFFDPRVYFTAPLPFLVWPGDGQTHSAMLVVISRPSALYTRLFATSVDIGSLLRNLLVAIAVFFGLLEILALWMATRLSRTITRSVAGLYVGTTEIDKGNLAFRVKPDRQDQLGALANSFNTMAGSIQDLLVQQREKERLLSELAIAQEVQRNLFPHSPAFVTGLELHAVCVPARSVSGDYFDFIFGGSSTSRGGTTTCIALGDISGKGISAALLMASLHSAVRAFSLGEEDLVSPARLLDLLNRHLYRSTTPEKYATLFIAFYEASTRRLTYANGGHLPPLILAADGSVQRLEAGGSVVGLLDALSYGEATVQLQPGDLLVAYSDGLTEPENGTVEFGEERLLALLQTNRDLALPAITEATFKTLKGWIGEHEQPDDMTLLLARQL